MNRGPRCCCSHCYATSQWLAVDLESTLKFPPLYLCFSRSWHSIFMQISLAPLFSQTTWWFHCSNCTDLKISHVLLKEIVIKSKANNIFASMHHQFMAWAEPIQQASKLLPLSSNRERGNSRLLPLSTQISITWAQSPQSFSQNKYQARLLCNLLQQLSLFAHLYRRTDGRASERVALIKQNKSISSRLANVLFAEWRSSETYLTSSMQMVGPTAFSLARKYPSFNKSLNYLSTNKLIYLVLMNRSSIESI